MSDSIQANWFIEAEGVGGKVLISERHILCAMEVENNGQKWTSILMAGMQEPLKVKLSYVEFKTRLSFSQPA